MFTTKEAKILDGTPNYLVIEELGRIDSLKHFEEILYEMKKHIRGHAIPSASIVLNEKDAKQTQYTILLEELSYQKQETQYFYKRDLTSFELLKMKASLEIKSLEETTSDVFIKTWTAASSGSLNASISSNSLSVEKEFEGMKSELGSDYKRSCLVIFYENQPLGVTMPQIEQGTIDEGRLFYFGILPSFRNKGWGEYLHKLSLHLLKKMGANYYIGATGQNNVPMQRIFQANDCELIERKFIYKLVEQN
ncbi:GNAT family N-acetyltransferase [Alkalicoccus urumqiensis]|uniref:N-acetyltransferase domain-containing protein n=1 Tax=Alkalicoccus urumqiensis TaxID=1548213 RepID=A0A2P6MJL5_ALKUR|nr:GNAT family N-acetyltransferase [Alkalicoccus urumqiensis]PRO66469.1 hypothetical protein C6I21_03775 [Alkalicoccus urumqiensis]